MKGAFKLNEAQAADFHAHIRSIGADVIEKLAKDKDANGTFDVIISTEDVDRAGEIVRQNGWDFTNYKNNPVVLWAHDYHSLPIGVCTETYLTEKDGIPALGARGFFYSADINPLAQQVRKMYDLGVKNGLHVGCTTSVGFIPKDFDENSYSVITKAELLEFSFVPVPANQGVGPAAGRAITFEEAKELGLDMGALRTKGLEIDEPADETSYRFLKDWGDYKAGAIISAADLGDGVIYRDLVKASTIEEVKAAQAGDECTMDDGTPGVLAEGSDGLVCQPKEEKSIDAKPLQKKLLTSIGDEHARHTGEIEKALDAFTGEKEGLKDLRDALRDELALHRGNSVTSFRGFDPEENAAFDRNPHLKALRTAHDEHEARITKTLEEFEAKSAKATAEETEELADWLTAKFDDGERTHKKTVAKLAKAMCKSAFGEDEPADEHIIEILKEFLTPHLDPQIAKSIIDKVGARVSSATREKLGEAHEHMKAALGIVQALHGGLKDDDGEDGRSSGDGKTAPAPAPRRQRSKPSEAPNELNDFLFAKDLVKEMTTVAQRGLENLNRRARQ